MNFEIRKIRVKELENFVNSKTYNDFAHVPISPSRAQSYIHNPNAHADDVALMLGYQKDELVAYRSFFAGTLRTEEQSFHFGWCSGNWVHPEFRRKGFSKRLLKEAFKDWNGKLVFTNYAPASEQLYLKTGWFHVVHRFNGVRAYLYPKTLKLLPLAKNRPWLRPFFRLTDKMISVASEIRTVFYRQKINPDIRFEVASDPDKQCFDHLKKYNQDLFFGRREEELKWIFKYPWVSEENKQVKDKYSFSSYSKTFHYRVIKIFRKEKFGGFFIYSVKDGHLKTLYFSVGNNLEKEIADYLKKICVKKKIESATVYNSVIANLLFERKFPFLHVKRYSQKIYSSFQIGEPGKSKFQDGDGDVIFT